jgi:transcriptional regulator with XRE-family HTH domain
MPGQTTRGPGGTACPRSGSWNHSVRRLWASEGPEDHSTRPARSPRTDAKFRRIYDRKRRIRRPVPAQLTRRHQPRSGAIDRIAPKPRLLAVLLGIAQPTLSAYESGHRQPTLPTLMRMLARAGLELRLDLAQTDNHDAMRAEWERTLEESDKDRLRSQGYRLVSDAAWTQRRSRCLDLLSPSALRLVRGSPSRFRFLRPSSIGLRA